MGEQGDQGQHRNQFELDLLAAMGQLLGQGVELPVKDPDADRAEQHDVAGEDEQGVGLPRRGDERRQVVRGGRMHWRRHLGIS